MPALVTYQILDGAAPSEPTPDRAVVERFARRCLSSHAGRCLDATVIETRYNVVRSNVPHEVIARRTLRDYLPTADAWPGEADGGRRRPLESESGGSEAAAG